ncbi:MAG TPA: 3-oxoacyl-ACP reductase family protein [candidate division Zixibacteria bacterium]|nr:3-oxoacyl-ACP reductase family protein [candidate division Zixibacteria bacterium]
MRLAGKVAVVTGAARHIGAAYARRLAAEGAAVVIADVLDGAPVAEQIRAAGGKALALRTDVSSEGDTVRMAARTVEAFGRIDVLVNNAAVFLDIRRRPFHEISAEEWDRVAAVNIKGPFLCAKSVFPWMKQQRSGKIINISSSTVFAGTPLFLHYVTSKAALVGMTRSLAREVGRYGICVNAIAPGLVEHEGQNAPREFTEFQLKARCLKRLQTPDDLLGALVYLASSDSDFVTGQTLVVDGGSVLR